MSQSGASADDVSAETSGGAIPGLEMAPWPKVNFERYGPVERVQRSRIQKISAPNLARNWVMIPHVTHNDEADITDLEAWRKQLNQELSADDVKMTMVSFLIAASVVTLKEFPDSTPRSTVTNWSSGATTTSVSLPTRPAVSSCR